MEKFRVLDWPFKWEFLSGGTPQASQASQAVRLAPGTNNTQASQAKEEDYSNFSQNFGRNWLIS